MRLSACILAVALLPGAVLAQDRAQSLADIKAELNALNGQFSGLKNELISTGAVSAGMAGGSALQRLDAIEAALMRLTAQTEQVELRVSRVISDGTNRIGDLEFRVTELEGGDPTSVPPAQPLGGETQAQLAPTATPPSSGAASGEQENFDRAREVLGQGDFRTAAQEFETFAQTFPGSPLMQEALILRGDALKQSGDLPNAARAYLDAFSGQPDGGRASDALFRLGRSLADLGQNQEACITLQEVGARFPGSAAAGEASAALAGLTCP